MCAARQHEAAEIGAHPPFMYVLPIPARPYLVQGLRSARAEGASGGGSAVAAAGVACRTIDASCTAHLMPRAASSQLHVPCLWEDFCLVMVNMIVTTPCWLYTVHSSSRAGKSISMFVSKLSKLSHQRGHQSKHLRPAQGVRLHTKV